MFIINTKINKSNIISNKLLLYNFYCAFSTFQTEINTTLNVLNSKLSSYSSQEYSQNCVCASFFGLYLMINAYNFNLKTNYSQFIFNKIIF